jgi:hypothetical protein
MPCIGFDEESLNLCGYSGMVSYLRDVMTYPDLTSKEITARQMCHWTHEKIFALDCTGSSEITDKDSMFTIEEIKYATSFDISRLESEESLRNTHGSYAGNVICYIWQLELNGITGSVGKSVYLMEKMKGVSASSVRKAWSKYNSVAHFYAAEQVRDLILPRENMDFSNAEDPTSEELNRFRKALANWRPRDEVFVILSMYFYNFSTKRIEPKTQRPLISVENAWIFPESLLPLKRGIATVTAMFDATKWPLTEEELAALKDYKANHAY